MGRVGVVQVASGSGYRVQCLERPGPLEPRPMDFHNPTGPSSNMLDRTIR